MHVQHSSLQAARSGANTESRRAVGLGHGHHVHRRALRAIGCDGPACDADIFWVDGSVAAQPDTALLNDPALENCG